MQKCEIIPYAFNPNIHVPESTGKTLEKDKPVILFVGALRFYKGVRYLIKALSKVKNANLKIIGRGEEEEYLRKLTYKLDFEERISFLNNVSDEELPSHYKNASIMVLPSISAAEAFGIVQLEAMVHGLPIINTDLPCGVPFVSLNNVTGITEPLPKFRTEQ